MKRLRRSSRPARYQSYDVPPLHAGEHVPARIVKILGRELLCASTDSRREDLFRLVTPFDKPHREYKQGALVLLKLVEVSEACRHGGPVWQAEMLHCYGREDDARVQEAFVRLNHEVPDTFPPRVLEQAHNLPRTPSAADMARREDIRHIPLVTIDGEDARDFDDAIHVAKDGEGWILRVAIADVSHYIPLETSLRKSTLDTEARLRGNSWYFPLSVSPMLPEALSNGLCSLNPHVDRLVMLCEIHVVGNGVPGRARFAEAVMRSAARLTYTQVQQCLLEKDKHAIATMQQQEHGAEILKMLQHAHELSRLLRQKRMARGSLDFHQPEAGYDVDDNGVVRDIFLASHHEGHELIEEFMLAANEAVAAFLQESGLPFLYRVHPEPTEESLERLQEALALIAPECLPKTVRSGDTLLARHLPEILRLARDSEKERIVNNLCLRSLSQACYQPDPLEHFGLRSSCYCHFTSPIRRYADLMVHRTLKVALGLHPGPLLSGQKLARLAAHLNHQERAAQECEREMTKRMACLAMQNRVGTLFYGIVSSVLPFGTFVTLEQLPVDAFLRGQRNPRRRSRSGKEEQIWHVGQRLKVRLTSVNLSRLAIDCEIANNASSRKKHYKKHSKVY